MKAMILDAPRTPLQEIYLPLPIPGADQVLIQVRACGVCRTDLHVVDGELTEPKLPIIPGHEIVGIVAGVGERVERLAMGDRVGVPWLGFTCGRCRYCRTARENLCDRARFTGYQIDGGYRLLWGERTVRSVANLTRRDGEEFMALAPTVPVRTEVQTFPLAEANEALRRLKQGKIRGAAVLVTI